MERRRAGIGLTCAGCGGAIGRGEEIVAVVRADGWRDAFHPVCRSKRNPAPPPSPGR